jgi:hypothetical protein
VFLSSHCRRELVPCIQAHLFRQLPCPGSPSAASFMLAGRRPWPRCPTWSTSKRARHLPRQDPHRRRSGCVPFSLGEIRFRSPDPAQKATPFSSILFPACTDMWDLSISQTGWLLFGEKRSAARAASSASSHRTWVPLVTLFS